ncbi:MAG: 50S ribosomal protein L2 [Kiritimatiellae bacterium]|nr:50S ribosomal protein L2 [Kiritimatiellia bacterium]MDD3544478.1 50S ribosomal protein L2 [Kiritimatiellia bacterium]MDD4621671.1 50S ribosomal protein L2 [Kiritimatiellia bacterium]
MGLKTFKPRSEGLRHRVAATFEEITEVKPQRGLTEARKNQAGRNNKGRITVRHRGGGVKRRYRIVDFRRDKIGIPARVEAIAYDPNRSANLALLKYVDGEKRYILAPAGLKVNDAVMAGPEAEPSVGNALPLSQIPLGFYVHNIEMVPGKGGKLARSAGNSCQLMARDGDFVTLKLPSGEVRLVRANCMATVGQVGNAEWSGVKLGKAGRKRWMGIRPTVRGVAMNPVDHPMGGGEGRTSGGSHPRSPWGKLAKGGKTRSRRKTSSRYILKRRK